MAPRFKVLVFLFCLGFASTAAAGETEQNSEALQMVAERMRSLSQSLSGLPQPPSLNQKIQLPDSLLAPAKPAAVQEKKENQE
jgi:hypothetical protein